MVAKSLDGTIAFRYNWQSQYRLAAYADGVNSPEYMIYQGKRYMFVKDHRGSVNLVVDVDTGTISQKIEYSEFGEVLSDTNPGFQPFGFAGGLYDPDTKLVRFGARDYDGKLGRWLAKDPIRFDGGDENLYGYVLNDPVNFIDPNGNAYQRSESSTYSEQFTEGTKEFYQTYKEMKERNLAKSDKYFHCMANCRSAKNGKGGEDAARLYSAAREAFQLPTDGFEACSQDMAANQAGREAAKSKQSCSQSCAGYAVNSLISTSPWD